MLICQLKVKQEKEHELMQKERNKMQLEAAKQASIERLVSGLMFSTSPCDRVVMLELSRQLLPLKLFPARNVS
jgi:hypothetical protein